MRDTPERDLAVAEDRLQMADGRIRELEERIRTLESACEAALRFINKVRGTTWYARNEEAKDVVEQLEGAIKHG